jgi:hypothetical protein
MTARNKNEPIELPELGAVVERKTIKDYLKAEKPERAA